MSPTTDVIPDTSDVCAPPAASNEHPFDGFAELIEQPLTASDPLSVKRIKRMFLEIPGRQATPFRLLLLRLTGKPFHEEEARSLWRRVLAHKTEIQTKLGRVVGVQTAAVDFFDLLANPRGPLKASVSSPEASRSDQEVRESAQSLLLLGSHVEKLREEMLRSKRYRHALAAIMLAIEGFTAIEGPASGADGDRIPSAVVKIMRRTIRTVDILARHDDDRFMVILPNTNKREALELAERLRKNVASRSRRIAGNDAGISVTAAVEQWSFEEGALEFIGRLEGMLERGKTAARDAVYSS